MAGAAVLERLTPRPRVVWREATVTAVAPASANARMLTLDVPGWPGHRAGQHVDVRLTAEDGYQAQRSYSIASAPESPAVELAVALVEDGEVSPYLVEEVRPGDTFEVRGPVGGHFTWAVGDGGPILLVAGGSGLVPVMAMLRHRAARGSTVPARVLVSARTAADVLFRAELERLGPAAGLSVTVTLTREAPRRRVDGELLAAVGAPLGSRCFVCGPTPFVEAVSDLLLDAGHDPRNIHAERFGPTGG